MSKKPDLFERGAAAHAARIAQTTQRQANEVQRKESGTGKGVIGRVNKQRAQEGIRRPGRSFYGFEQ